MKIKTGVDIIEVERIKEAIEKTDGAFLKKVYTDSEIDYCNNSANMKYQHFAVRFAAKEAVFKAISEYLKLEDYREEIWKHICIKNNENGRPYVELVDMDFLKIQSMDLSLSHIKDYAIANFVVIMD